METGEVEEMNDFDCINEVYDYNDYNNEEEEAQQELSNIEEEQPTPASPRGEDEDVQEGAILDVPSDDEQGGGAANGKDGSATAEKSFTHPEE